MRVRPVLLSTLALTAVWSCKSSDTAATGNEAAPSNDTTTAASEPIAASSPVTNAGTQDPAGGQGGGFIDDEAARVSRLRARGAELAAQYLASADAKAAAADLEGALADYATALDFQPSNQAARDGVRRMQAWLGDRYALVPDFMEDEVTREIVRRTQARLEVEDLKRDGDNLRRTGDFEGAMARYRQAELILTYQPAVEDLSGVSGDELRNIMDGLLREQEQYEAEQRERAIAEAEADRERRETEAREHRVNQLRGLYREAWSAYQREDYRESEMLANQILLLDPGNEDAALMRDTSREARHRLVNETTRRDMREQWVRTFEELDTMALPQVQPIIFDDLRRWREVSTRTPYEFSDATSRERQASADAILGRLEQARVVPQYGTDDEGAALEVVAEYLQQATGVNFVISSMVRNELDEEDTAVNLDMPERSVRKVLDLITDLSEDLSWKIENGVVKFVHIDEMIGGQVLRMYDVQDLIRPVRDFPGRELNVEPSGGLEPPDEDLDEREALVVNTDSLEGLIRDNIHPESWDADPNNAIQITEQGVLVVNQTPLVHDDIQRLLDDLREATGIMVDIQTRFLSVEDNFLEDIGVDFRGLGSPGKGTNEFFDDFGDPGAQATLGQEIGQSGDLGGFLSEGNTELKARIEDLYDQDLGDEDVLTPDGGLSFQWVYLNDLQMEMILRAVAKSERVEIVTAPRLLVFNTARANITVLNQLAYVQDFDVEIAQGASIADPIVNVVEDGVVLDMRPVVSADRRFVTLELRPTVATLQRPIAEITTTLGAASSVTIQLPELEIARVRTTVPMPDGGTVMLGGLKISERQDLRSGVPILNKIPVVNFLFERKGNFVSKRKLLILLKAGIVIPEEHEPTAAQLGNFEVEPR